MANNEEIEERYFKMPFFFYKNFKKEIKNNYRFLLKRYKTKDIKKEK